MSFAWCTTLHDAQRSGRELNFVENESYLPFGNKSESFRSFASHYIAACTFVLAFRRRALQALGNWLPVEMGFESSRCLVGRCIRFSICQKIQFTVLFRVYFVTQLSPSLCHHNENVFIFICTISVCSILFCCERILALCVSSHRGTDTHSLAHELNIFRCTLNSIVWGRARSADPGACVCVGAGWCTNHYANFSLKTFLNMRVIVRWQMCLIHEQMKIIHVDLCKTVKSLPLTSSYPLSNTNTLISICQSPNHLTALCVHCTISRPRHPPHYTHIHSFTDG